MRTTGEFSLACAMSGLFLALVMAVPAHAQTAADAAFDFAKTLDGNGAIVSSDTYLSALESDAAAGRPLALWQLGTMYETGEGVDKDPVKAFGYFAQIANQHADTAPKGLEADIVASSFVKLGEYFRIGVPEAGVSQNPAEYHRMLMHAATYFGDAEAQYRIGMLYQQEEGLGRSPMLSARWLLSAAHKGHCLAQAQLGNLLFNGMEKYDPRPAEGLMWLNFAQTTCLGTGDVAVAEQMLNNAMAVATPEVRAAAVEMANSGVVISTEF